MLRKKPLLARDLSLGILSFFFFATLLLPWQPPDLSLFSNLSGLSEGPSKQVFSSKPASLGILAQVHLASHN